MTETHYLLLLVAWMWWLGGVLLWLFMDELTHRAEWRWRDVALCIMWPISLPALIAFYRVFADKQDR
jgi:hypothetical protein